MTKELATTVVAAPKKVRGALAENHGIQFQANEIEFEEHGGLDRGKMKLRCMEIRIHGSLGCGEVGLGCGEVGLGCGEVVHGGLEAV